MIGGFLHLADQHSLAYLVSSRLKQTLSQKRFMVFLRIIFKIALWLLHVHMYPHYTWKKMRSQWCTYPALEQNSWQMCHLKYNLTIALIQNLYSPRNYAMKFLRPNLTSWNISYNTQLERVIHLFNSYTLPTLHLPLETCVFQDFSIKFFHC